MSTLPPNHRAESERITALEEKLAFQQRVLDELNSVVLSQQAEIDRMRREVAQLTAALRAFIEQTGDNLPHEKPPHY
jgi:SlyX protein